MNLSDIGGVELNNSKKLQLRGGEPEGPTLFNCFCYYGNVENKIGEEFEICIQSPPDFDEAEKVCSFGGLVGISVECNTTNTACDPQYQ